MAFVLRATIVQTICVNVVGICWPVRTGITINKYSKQQCQPQVKQQEQQAHSQNYIMAQDNNNDNSNNNNDNDNKNKHSFRSCAVGAKRSAVGRQTKEPVLRRPLRLSLSFFLCRETPCERLTNVCHALCCTKHAKLRRQVQSDSCLTVSSPLPCLS